MAKEKKSTEDVKTPTPRLRGAERRDLTLAAARLAFIKAGDMSSTTLAMIAKEANISEGAIYKHFESKDQMFAEAIVEPLTSAMESVHQMRLNMVHEVESGVPDSVRDLDAVDVIDLVQSLLNRVSGWLVEYLPLFSMVMFGEPTRAQAFYTSTYAPALKSLEERVAEGLASFDPEYPAECCVRGIMGMCLALALDARYDSSFDVEKSTKEMAQLIVRGFWPAAYSEGYSLQ